MSTLGERLVAVLKEHDLRRWMRMLKGDRSFDCLRCYCGEKIYEDSNEAMLGHVADALAAEVADAPLPLQRTLPDEQFKGAVVERIARNAGLTGTQVLAAVNECVDLHGIGPDFPATWVDSNINFNELAESLNKRLAPSRAARPAEKGDGK